MSNKNKSKRIEKLKRRKEEKRIISEEKRRENWRRINKCEKRTEIKPETEMKKNDHTILEFFPFLILVFLFFYLLKTLRDGIKLPE